MSSESLSTDMVITRVSQAARRQRQGKADQALFDPIAQWVEEQLASENEEAFEAVRAGLAAQAPDALPWFGWVARSVASTNVFHLPGHGDRYVFLAGIPVYWRHPDQQDDAFLFIDRLACGEDIARNYLAAANFDADVDVRIGSNPVAFNELQHLSPVGIRDLLVSLVENRDQMDPLALDAAVSDEDLFVSTAWPLIFTVSATGHESFLEKGRAIGRTPALTRFAAMAAALLETEMTRDFDVATSVSVYPAILWRDLPSAVRMMGLTQSLQGMMERYPQAQGLHARIARGWLTLSLVDAQGEPLMSSEHQMPDEPAEQVASGISNIANSLKLSLTIDQ